MERPVGREALLDRVAGHHQGAEAVRQTVQTCRKLGVPYLTLFAFSSENWSRPREEVDALMILLKEFLSSELRKCSNRESAFRPLGTFSAFRKMSSRSERGGQHTQSERTWF